MFPPTATDCDPGAAASEKSGLPTVPTSAAAASAILASLTLLAILVNVTDNVCPLDAARYTSVNAPCTVALVLLIAVFT